MSIIFLETSAFLSLLFRESKCLIVEQALDKADRVIASRLLKVEAERAFLRAQASNATIEKLVPDIERAMQSAWSRMDFFELTREICDRAGEIAPKSVLRTLDAIHLATFYKAREISPRVEMLSFDNRINELL